MPGLIAPPVGTACQIRGTVNEPFGFDGPLSQCQAECNRYEDASHPPKPRHASVHAAPAVVAPDQPYGASWRIAMLTSTFGTAVSGTDTPREGHQCPSRSRPRRAARNTASKPATCWLISDFGQQEIAARQRARSFDAAPLAIFPPFRGLTTPIERLWQKQTGYKEEDYDPRKMARRCHRRSHREHHRSGAHGNSANEPVPSRYRINRETSGYAGCDPNVTRQPFDHQGRFR
jgi:hypothetical protein